MHKTLTKSAARRTSQPWRPPSSHGRLGAPTRRRAIQQPAKTIGHRFRQGRSWKVVMGCRYGVGGHHGLVGEFSAQREVYIRIVLRILPLNSSGRCFFSTTTRRNSRNPRAVFAYEQFSPPVASSYLILPLCSTIPLLYRIKPGHKQRRGTSNAD